MKTKENLFKGTNFETRIKFLADAVNDEIRHLTYQHCGPLGEKRSLRQIELYTRIWRNLNLMHYMSGTTFLNTPVWHYTL